MKNPVPYIFLFFSVSFFVPGSYIDAQTTLTVGAGKAYATISSAITAASNNDIIDIYGTITESHIMVNKNLTIQGQGASLTIVQGNAVAGASLYNIFNIGLDVTATIKNISIRNGNADVTHDAEANGGGIANNRGALTLLNCHIYDNTVNGYSFGGGVFVFDGTLTAENCTFSNNFSEEGGAISVYGASSVTLTNCTLSGNTSNTMGGGIDLANGASATLINCTVAYNQALFGGGILVNENTTLSIKNSLIANNNAASEHIGDDIYHYAGTLNNNGNNLVEIHNSGSISNGVNGCISGDQASLNLFSDLAINNSIFGTPTLKLTTGSVAINAGTSTGTPSKDQRGAERNGVADIGAYEYWSDDGTLPVELISFTASSSDNNILLKWKTATEVNNYGFEIERQAGSQSNLQWEKVGFVTGSGNSNSIKEYSFIDGNASAGKIQYRLKQINTDGSYVYYKDIAEVNNNITGVEGRSVSGKVPAEYALNQNYPNPFNPTTRIQYAVPVNAKCEMSNVKLTVFDILGNEVAALVNENKAPGYYEVEFNAGKYNLSSGVYFYQLRINGYMLTKKLSLMK